MIESNSSLEKMWREIAQARRLLCSGHPVALPTETVYGLAARIDDSKAIEKIFRIKERPFFDPLIVHVSSIQQAEALVTELPGEARLLAERFWPGPLTLVLPKKVEVNPLISAGLETVAIRSPRHPIFRRLIRELKCPLAAPSANKFGRTSPTAAQHVRLSWSEEEVFVVDGGESEVGIESTVVQPMMEGAQLSLRILRPGMVKKSDIEDVLPHVTVSFQTSLASPGNLPQHYQPETPLIIVHEDIWGNKEYVFSQLRERYDYSLSSYEFLQLSTDPILAARELYRKLLDIDRKNVDFMIFVETASMRSHEGWTAILDRLHRASVLCIVSFD